METKEILNFCIKKGFLIDKETLEILSISEDFETTKKIIEKIVQEANTRIITKGIFNQNKEKVIDFFSNFSNLNEKNRLEQLKIKMGMVIEVSKEIPRKAKDTKENHNEKEDKREYMGENVKIVSMNPSFNKKLEVNDFIRYFRNRYSEMKGFLQEHSDLTNLVSINKVAEKRQGISIIGIVSDKRVTKNKNIIFELEDLTGKILALVSYTKEDLYKKAEDVALDSVIGIKCSGSSDMVFINDIIFPEAVLNERKKSPYEEWALFTGDLHIGSKKFMEESFLKFIDYINGKAENSGEAEKIKYLFLAGDLVAGVGIYPGQDKELNILDVENQYQKVAELLSKIKKEIKIIISPGNHDALRIMEPQPVLDEKFAWPLYNLKNVILTGNPAVVNIGARGNFSGMNVLTYHGYSFHYYANSISRLVKEKAVHAPEKIMEYLLRNRHLAPTHSSTLYFPSEEDPLIIREIPDIFLSGHTHKSAVAYYNNILMLSSSTWENLTAFQEKMGNEPDFCKVPAFNLKTRVVKILDFEDKKEEKITGE